MVEWIPLAHMPGYNTSAEEYLRTARILDTKYGR